MVSLANLCNSPYRYRCSRPAEVTYDLRQPRYLRLATPDVMPLISGNHGSKKYARTSYLADRTAAHRLKVIFRLSHKVTSQRRYHNHQLQTPSSSSRFPLIP